MRWWKRALIFGVGSVFLLVVAIVAHWKVYEYLTNVELNRIRAAGEPLTMEELGEYYRATAGDYPQQAEWLEVFAEIDRIRDDQRPEDQAFFNEWYDERWATFDSFHRYESRNVAEIEALVKRFDTAIRLAQRAAEHPGSIPWDVEKAGTHYWDNSPYLDLRRVCRLLLLASTVHVHQDDPRRAKRELLALLALGRSLESHPTSESLSPRIYLDVFAVNQTIDAVARTKFDDAELDELQKAIRSLRYEDHFRRSLLHERVRDLQSMEEYLSEGPYGMRREEGSDKVYSWGAGSKYTYLSRVRQMIDAVRLDWKSIYATEQRLSQSRHDSILLMLTDYDFVRIEDAHCYFDAEDELSATASSRSADAVIAIERYRRQHGLPQSLDELPKEFLAAVPEDPVDGLPMRLEVHDGWFCVDSDGCRAIQRRGFGPRCCHCLSLKDKP